MEITNTVLLISGVIVTLIGFVAFLNPNFAKWINAPGDSRLKAFIALITGVILIIVGFVIQFPG